MSGHYGLDGWVPGTPPQWLAEWQTSTGTGAHTTREAFDTEAAAQTRAEELVDDGQRWVVVYEVSGRYLSGRSWGSQRKATA